MIKNDWASIIIIASSIAVVGPVIDRFMLHRQKGKMYDWMLETWNDGRTRLSQRRRIASIWVRFVHFKSFGFFSTFQALKSRRA